MKAMRSTEIVDLGENNSYLRSMTPEQCRAARGWLGWPQDALAKAASVGVSTVRDFEAGRREPTRNNLTAMRVALEEGGVSFFEDYKESGIKVPRSTETADSDKK
jgi:DNA-binding transcriptional regulator YiaG